MNDLIKKSETRDQINELTAQAIHLRTGYDLDACRTDALMKQGLYSIGDSIEGITAFLGAKYDNPTDIKTGDKKPA